MSLDENLAVERAAEAIYDACPMVVGQGSWADATQITRAIFLKMALAGIAAYEPLAERAKLEKIERESW